MSVRRRMAFRLHRALLDPWSLWHRLTRHHWPFWYRTGYDFLTWRYECSICGDDAAGQEERDGKYATGHDPEYPARAEDLERDGWTLEPSTAAPEGLIERHSHHASIRPDLAVHPRDRQRAKIAERGRKGRAAPTPPTPTAAGLDALREALGWHQPVAESDDSTTMVCGRCGLEWPCDATQALAALSTTAAPSGQEAPK